MKTTREQFDTFLSAARRGQPQDVPAEAPFGLASSITAKPRKVAADYLGMWERATKWGAVAAILVALLATNLPEDDAPPNPLIEMMDEAEEAPGDP